jgi:hypothetical protein
MKHYKKKNIFSFFSFFLGGGASNKKEMSIATGTQDENYTAPKIQA